MSNLEERLGGGVVNPLAELQGEPTTMEEAWAAYEQGMVDFEEGQVVPGTIVGLLGEVVLVDIGWKSEGVVPKHEWSEPDTITVGQPVDVLIERTENDSGMIEVSKTKADRIKNWARIQRMYENGETIEGKIIKKVKGGLKVDIGLDAFLPASQVARRPTADLDQFLGKSLNFKIIKLTKRRRNVVLSRRQVLEEERSEEKARLLATIQIGMKLEGMVKNITEFGAFVDVGGIDGLLHITDMSWGRVKHPSELLKVGQDLEVVVLSFDKETEKISLGLKQLSENPWSVAAEKYPVNSTVAGKVVSMTDYGAFVELERGVEGMVHVSEMSWTKRVRHPSEVVSIGQEIEVRVLSVDDDSQKISLGIKQVGVNPWEEAAVKYPVGSSVTGRVRNLTDYGAFVELEDGIEGLLHVSDMSWTKKIGHPKELLETGGDVTVKVLNVDVANEKISLGMKQLEDDPWQDVVSRFQQGASLKTTISKLVSFGAFAELGEGVEGLIHISELSSDRVTKPEDAVNIGDEVTVKVISIDPTARKIGLSIRAHKEDEARKAMSSHTEKQGEFANTAMGEAFASISLPGEEAPAEAPAAAVEEAAPAAEAEAETADATDASAETETKDTITE